MPSPTASALADLKGKVLASESPGLDQLRLVNVPFVPEVRLHLAVDSIVWWARMEADAGTTLEPPLWASAWAGGQALARYILDHPTAVAGRRVLDLGSGSGLVAIAAARAAASAVLANDIDTYACAAITLNAKANQVAVTTRCGDLLDGDGADAEVVLAGDVFYNKPFGGRVLSFLSRVAARGARVLVGDPGRGHLPVDRFDVVTSYRLPTGDAFADSKITRVDVLRLRD